MRRRLYIIALTAGVVFASNSWAEPTFSFDLSTGTLTIGGTGEIDSETLRNAGIFQAEIYNVVFQEGSGITSIGNYAFSGATGLTSVTIPNSVTSIGDNAFWGATGLTSVTIPNSVTSIGDNAFRDATSLTSVTIPNSVTSIGDNAFANATSLTSVAIPNSVTSIGSYAFLNATSLTSVSIPDSVTSIGKFAFRNATSLTSVIIPDSVTSIGNFAFRNVNPTELTISSDKIEMYQSAKGGFENITALHCIDGQDACSQILNNLGITLPQGAVIDTATKLVRNPDGSYTVKTYNGTFKGYKGKRIYTVEEASKISKPAENVVKIKYK